MRLWLVNYGPIFGGPWSPAYVRQRLLEVFPDRSIARIVASTSGPSTTEPIQWVRSGLSGRASGLWSLLAVSYVRAYVLSVGR